MTAPRIAITGGTGFVGRHLAGRFENPAVISRRTGIDVDNVSALAAAFAGCDVVAHCAGINCEIGDQTYDRVHVRGTLAVIEAAKRAGVKKIVMLSFLRARPDCGSPYHESKWAAEEAIRASGLDYTILKAGMIYGLGDHLIDHSTRTVKTLPLFATVGLHERTVRPVPVEELVDVMVAALGDRLERKTVEVVGAEELKLSKVVRRVADLLELPIGIVPAPVWALYALGQLTEWTMKVPLVAKAQVRMLAEGVSHAVPGTELLPEDLRPKKLLTKAQIRAAMPDDGPFGWNDLLISG